MANISGRSFAPRQHDEGWINVVIQTTDGEDITLNMHGSLHLVSHVASKAHETGFVTIWNANQSIAIPMHRVKAVLGTALTKKENT